MDRILAGDPESQSPDLLAEQRDCLKCLYPEAFPDGRLDSRALQELLNVDPDEADESYGLTWLGKRRSRHLALTPSLGTLRPCREQSVDWNATQNLLIEGDNLEVLKLLQKSYGGRVKLIYIDPPYNTGRDFVYPDDYRDNIRNYLEITGQVDGANGRLSSNPELSGRFHTDWLNMLYPRLLLARYLLTADGVLLVSIDDTEVHNLRHICDEVFGPENFCGSFVWEKKKKPSFLDRNMGSVTDYVVAYAKNRPLTQPFGAGAVEDGKKYPFNNAGNPPSVLRFPARSVRFGIRDQLVRAQDMSAGNIKTELLDDVRIVAGVNLSAFRLKGEWRYSQERVDRFVAAGEEIVVAKVPFRPNYVNRSGEVKKSANLLSHRVNGVPTNEDGTAEMRSLLGADLFSYPKPTGLLKYLVRATSGGDDLVMDFFAGSGTTAGGVLLQNVEDGAKRRYILVQLQEPLDPRKKEQKEAVRFCDRTGRPRRLTELTKEYLRRMGEEVKSRNPLFSGDLGFRVLKLDSSNIRAWSPRPKDLDQELQLSIESLKDDRDEEDILFELLLKSGLDLCTPVEERVVAGKKVRAAGGGALIACLDRTIGRREAEDLGLGIARWHRHLAPARDSTCVFRDNAFVDDVAKANLTAILRQHDLVTVRSV